MNYNFWIVIATVSATFLGLIYIGLSVNLSSIRETTKEITTTFSVVVKSDKIMQSSLTSNIVLFIIPLITSLAILSCDNFSISSVLVLSIVLLIVIFVIICKYHENDGIKEQIKLIGQEKNEDEDTKIRSIIKERIIYIKLFIYSILILTIWLITLYVLTNTYRLDWINSPQSINRFINQCLSLIVVISLLLGVLCALLDYFIYDYKNIFFQIKKTDNNIYNIQSPREFEMQKIESQYHRLCYLLDNLNADQLKIISEKYGYPSDKINGQVKEKRGEIEKRYNDLRKQIPKNETMPIILNIQKKGDFLTFTEIKETKALLDAIDSDSKELYSELMDLCNSLSEIK